MKKTTQLRKLLERPDPTILCGVHDGLSAQLAERAGFDGLWASGFCISASKRLPDVGLVTMTEHLATSREICLASELPVVADVDDGFGDAVNVSRMIREYEAAGIAGVCLEDHRHPKRSSLMHSERRSLVSAESFARKVHAARESRSDPDFVIIARTEGLVAELGMEETLKRGRCYADAGADLVLVHSKAPTADEVLAFAKAWDRDVPLVSVPTKYPDITVTELHDAGFRMVIFANQGMRAAITAMTETFRKLLDSGTLASVESEVTSLKEMMEIVGYDDVKRIENQFCDDVSS